MPDAPRDPKTHRCPHCDSDRTVKTNQVGLRVFLFCLECAKSFEARADKAPDF